MQCRASNKSSFEKEVAEAGGAVSPGGAKKRASGGSKAAQKAKIADERSTDGFPGADDFFEGEKWEWLGFVTQYYYIFIVLITGAVGGFAANTYNDGATSFVEPAKEKAPMQIVDAKELFASESAPAVSAE